MANLMKGQCSFGRSLIYASIWSSIVEIVLPGQLNLAHITITSEYGTI
jgi:hypothetical protein